MVAASSDPVLSIDRDSRARWRRLPPVAVTEVRVLRIAAADVPPTSLRLGTLRG
jgi:hypothetical protein